MNISRASSTESKNSRHVPQELLEPLPLYTKEKISEKKKIVPTIDIGDSVTDVFALPTTSDRDELLIMDQSNPACGTDVPDVFGSTEELMDEKIDGIDEAINSQKREIELMLAMAVDRDQPKYKPDIQLQVITEEPNPEEIQYSNNEDDE